MAAGGTSVSYQSISAVLNLQEGKFQYCDGYLMQKVKYFNWWKRKKITIVPGELTTIILLNIRQSESAVHACYFWCSSLVLPKFGPRTIYCRTILVLGPFCLAKNGPTYLAYFGPLIFAARNGPAKILIGSMNFLRLFKVITRSRYYY